MRIGVISDTHDFLDPKIPKLFTGVDHILHAGDIGGTVIVLELEQIAPVTAVGGNTDDPGYHYKPTQAVELAGRKFLLQHILDPHSPPETIKARLDREHLDVIVFGHTHKPFCEIIGSTLYFNPGYAGKQRFRLERSVAVLHCTEEGIRAEHLRL